MTSEERVCKLLHVRYRKLGNGCRFYICVSVMCWKIFVASLYYALIWAGFNYHSICKVNNPNFQIIYKSTYTNVESVHFHLSISNNNTHKHKYHGNMLAFIYPVASKGRERVCVCVCSEAIMNQGWCGPCQPAQPYAYAIKNNAKRILLDICGIRIHSRAYTPLYFLDSPLLCFSVQFLL